MMTGHMLHLSQNQADGVLASYPSFHGRWRDRGADRNVRGERLEEKARSQRKPRSGTMEPFFAWGRGGSGCQDRFFRGARPGSCWEGGRLVSRAVSGPARLMSIVILAMQSWDDGSFWMFPFFLLFYFLERSSDGAGRALRRRQRGRKGACCVIQGLRRDCRRRQGGGGRAKFRVTKAPRSLNRLHTCRPTLMGLFLGGGREGRSRRLRPVAVAEELLMTEHHQIMEAWP